MIPAFFAAVVIAVAGPPLPALPSPSPSPSPSPAPRTIGGVHVATGSPASLHALPLAAAAIDGQTLAGSGEPLDAALRALPGFDRGLANAGFSNFGLNRLSIGGAGTDRAGLLVDGVPGLDPFGGQVDWATLPSTAITRAEILIGPGSALYGSGAIGGALDLRTFSAADVTTPVIAPSVTLGGITQGGTFLTGTQIGEHWKVAAWGDTSRTTFGALPPSQTRPNATAATTVTDATRETAQYTNGNVVLNLGTLFGNDAQAEGRPNDTFSRDTRQADASLSDTSGATTTTFRLYDRAFDLVNEQDNFPKDPGVALFTQSVASSDAGATLDLLHSNGDLGNVLVRLETRLAQGEASQVQAAGGFGPGGGGTERTEALAFQFDREFDRLHLLLGARADDIFTDASISGGASVNDRAEAISPRAAASWAFTPALSLRTYAGTGLRTPYLNELVRGFRVGAVVEEPNLNLVPERSRGGGVGLDYASGPNRVAVDLQSTAVFDALGFRTLNPTLQIRSNFGATRTDGTQVQATHDLACGRLDLSAAEHYARIVADVNPDLIGKRLTQVPDRDISAGWAGGRDLIVEARVTAIGQAFADDLNTEPLGSAVIEDLSVTRPLERGAITLGVTNLGNATYLTNVDRMGPPSNVWLRYSLAPRTTRCK
jgi:outer membrane cobalamin receptor